MENSLEENGPGEMGGGCERVYKEGHVYADGVEGEVLDIKVSGKGERKGFPEGVVIEKGGAGVGGGNDQRRRLLDDHHIVPPRCPVHLCFGADSLDNSADITVNGCKHVDVDVVTGSRKAEYKGAET